ncbi:cadherin-related family member 5-like [Solea senegalensis]|uniref:Cadherin-related family member 5-like n=1 Tax=Solea senegalensis TaxID=28829 RepID=A0AAV6SWB2_SOLSE|nr:cadherin-related family member 5-like isoform X2 [Solea senegalensis]KAG7521723.1 cadherin-related family member 5-like [Solea senegalensis]KAG7521724.1 cadherin-related family member 5-like [Solea senegalensis]
MDAIQSHFLMRTSLIFLLLYLFQPSAAIETEICAGPKYVDVVENNSVGDVIANITIIHPGVTLTLKPPSDNTFRLRGRELLTAIEFDYENPVKSYDAIIICSEEPPGERQMELKIPVFVLNVNDNRPVFDQNTYHVNVSEASPVGTSVGQFAATDQDKDTQLFYTLTSDSMLFKLRSPTIPDVLTNATLDYEKVDNVRLVLYAQDTPLTKPEKSPSFTATTTIMVTITDQDNRPPWFQPCTKQNNGEAVICYSTGYTGSVVLNQIQTGVLPLEPGPLYAIDGDSGINEEITYLILSGNDGDYFEINANTGNISMLKPVNRPDTIHLTVLAAQKKNRNQFATTTVTISVLLKSDFRPQFQKSSYKGLITKVGSMAMDNDKPLIIHATDKDYPEEINPFIVYSVIGSDDFSILNGYLFMTKDLPDSTLSLHVVATDDSNGESDRAELIVEVKSGLTTTTVPMSTTTIMTTTAIDESTKSSQTTEDIQVSTTNHKTSTISEPSTISGQTSIPSTTSDAVISTTDSIIIPPGSYGSQDMIALGVTLGILLFACLVVIGVLVHRMRKEKADWRKIYEVNVFRSSLGQSSGGFKKEFQYTNEAFQNTADEGGMGSGPSAVDDTPLTQAVRKSTLPLHTLQSDDTSDTGSDKADSEKEVKPILTKERRMEEGYKAVWFKEDIDPNAKEEVVIIPDSRVDDSEDEEDEEEEERPKSSNKTLKMDTDDTDLDSGLGVKMGDPPEDSDDDEALTSNL